MNQKGANSLGRRLSVWLAWQSLGGLLIVCATVYGATHYAFAARQLEELGQKQALLTYLATEAARTGDDVKLKHELDDLMVGHPQLGLSVAQADGAIFHEKLLPSSRRERRVIQFNLDSPKPGQQMLRTELSLDVGGDALVLRRIAWILFAAAVGGVLLISFGGSFLVWIGLRPLRELSAQVQVLTAGTLHHRLDGSRQPDELAPLIAQFNDLLARLDQSYEQMEGFNADVAHELLTPLTTLMSGAELAMHSSKSPDEIRELLSSNLEDLQRIAGIVHDMLFLSQADRGAVARRTSTPSLAAVVRRVAEYHEATLDDAGLTLEVKGDVDGEFDLQLLQRAFSNLVSNATRYATKGSSIVVRIEPDAFEQVTVLVENRGAPIDQQTLSKMFDRFFRADVSRSGASKNHGLGLSIVAAIARMHGGTTMAASSSGITSVGILLKRFAK
ncbi:MAG: heavy metal sensor histidine kinase [Hydrogenophaga sp.]|jgi:two-component system heavy metal sensor histidine kinase CusS|uniref:heavy metal sensor histidine kinase n=1 Tax=Hydrogenophaga sp. TaxID=1904254 RepID=UPI001D5B0CAB|nr:heavy metal sensor histidine kinase [Hydrogenophaga sp.]MBW0170341.1 heavy metal sensor histidine kinase [Hydrogenophaga sp.]MBW0184952.1 heavy metal sensor histidine kinase [Hydrogenophaga sp.]